MKEFEPDQFLFMGGIHAARKIGASDSPLSQQEREDCLHDVGAAEILCDKLGFSLSKMAIERIRKSLSEDTVSEKEFIKLVDELDHRIVDEMKARKFLCMEPDKNNMIDGKDLFSLKVSTAFPSTTMDIEEAAKCIGFREMDSSCVPFKPCG